MWSPINCNLQNYLSLGDDPETTILVAQRPQGAAQKMFLNPTTFGQNLYRSEFALLQFIHGAGTAALGSCCL